MPVEATEIFSLTAVTCSGFASIQNCGDNCKVSVYSCLKRCTSCFRGTAFAPSTVVMVLGTCLPASLQQSVPSACSGPDLLFTGES